jgi:hypothetical protein
MKNVAAIIFCALIATWQYVVVTLADCGDCNLRMQQIAQGHSQAPFAYRVLTPHIIMAMGNTAQALVIFHLMSFATFFILLGMWARRWNAPPVPIYFICALAMVVMLPTYYFSAYTVMEWNLWLCGLLLLPRWSLLAHLTAK